MGLTKQVVWLFVLALPVASVAWTVTHEEVFREPRDYRASRSETSNSLFRRKFFYLFTCEYCFSHWVAAAFLIITRYKLLFDDWRGYLIALLRPCVCGKFLHRSVRPRKARGEERPRRDQSDRGRSGSEERSVKKGLGGRV